MKCLFFCLLVVSLSPMTLAMNGVKEMTKWQQDLMEQVSWDVKLELLKSYLHQRPDFHLPLKDRTIENIPLPKRRRSPDLSALKRFESYGKDEVRVDNRGSSNENDPIPTDVPGVIYNLFRKAKKQNKRKPKVMFVLLND